MSFYESKKGNGERVADCQISLHRGYRTKGFEKNWGDWQMREARFTSSAWHLLLKKTFDLGILLDVPWVRCTFGSLSCTQATGLIGIGSLGMWVFDRFGARTGVGVGFGLSVVGSARGQVSVPPRRGRCRCGSARRTVCCSPRDRCRFATADRLGSAQRKCRFRAARVGVGLGSAVRTDVGSHGGRSVLGSPRRKVLGSGLSVGGCGSPRRTVWVRRGVGGGLVDILAPEVRYRAALARHWSSDIKTTVFPLSELSRTFHVSDCFHLLILQDSSSVYQAPFLIEAFGIIPKIIGAKDLKLSISSGHSFLQYST